MPIFRAKFKGLILFVGALAGGYNFPLRCVDFVIARFCVDPDDWRGGGLGALAWDPSLAPEPIPVRIQDGFNGPK